MGWEDVVKPVPQHNPARVRAALLQQIHTAWMGGDNVALAAKDLGLVVGRDGELTGPLGRYQVTSSLPRDGTVRLRGVPLDAQLQAEPPIADFSWLHPSVIERYDPLLARGRAGVADGVIWIQPQDRSERALIEILDEAFNLAEALADLPDTATARLTLALEAETSPKRRRQLMIARFSLGRVTALRRTALLAHPDPAIRLQVGMAWADAEVLRSVAMDPSQPAESRVVAALAILEEPVLLAVLEVAPRHQRLLARALANVGTHRAVPALRAIRAHAALRKIQARIGVGRGAVSLADDSAGRLSETPTELSPPTAGLEPG